MTGALGVGWGYADADSFGPQIARWNGVVSSREYIHHGLLNAGVFYGISAGFLVLFSLLGQGKGAYVSRHLSAMC